MIDDAFGASPNRRDVGEGGVDGDPRQHGYDTTLRSRPRETQPQQSEVDQGVSKKPTPDDIDLIKTAQAHLRSLWSINFPKADEYSIRAASASLRFLLVDGHLARAWRALGIGEPIQIEGYCFSSNPGPDAVGFCGGADILPGIPFSTGWGEDIRLEIRTLNITAYLNGFCISVKGVRIARLELVRYIANTKGGAHYDPEGNSSKSRRGAFPLLRELEKKGSSLFCMVKFDRRLRQPIVSWFG